MNLDTVSPALSFYHLLQNLSPEELAGLKTSLAQYFMEGPGKASGVTCLYFVEEVLVKQSPFDALHEINPNKDP